MKLIFNAPFNSLSFGNVAYNLAREMYKKDIKVGLFPIGDKIDINAFDKTTEDFKNWLADCVKNRYSYLRKDIPTLRLWHLNGSETKLNGNQTLFTFYELDSPTFAEGNIAALQDNIVFSSKYSESKFDTLSNASSVSIGFDQDFRKIDRKYLSNKIHFGLMGKWEKRKHTEKILKLWAKKYGNDTRYQLSCCVVNPFVKQEQMNQIIAQALEGVQYNNINFFPYLNTNSEVNDFLNAIDIDLTGLSGAEGWNLPAFNATALGKWSIVLNATSHKDWASGQNSILVNPDGKEPSHDGVFFHNGHDFNQGNIYTWDEDEVVEAFEKGEKLARTENSEGLKLQKEFTYEKTLDNLLKVIDS